MRLLLILSFLGLSACAGLQRDPRTGYMDDGEITGQVEDLYKQKQMSVINEAREELGLQGRPLTAEERIAVVLRVHLKRKESRLPTKREKKQYYQLRSALKSDRQRLAFLGLPTFEARERWAQSRGIGTGEEKYSDELAQVIEANDIALGMSQKAVTESWGDPDAVETAGNQLYGFERWRYNRYVSGNEGYQKEVRVVYFEGGHVVGWERN
jgi:hypothetical protein